VTEGEDKPLKYPTILHTADLAVVTKIDLAEAVECDLQELRTNLQAVRPGIGVIEVSAKSGHGLEQWLSSLESRRSEAVPGGEPRPAERSLV
jgi:hydrogenase nickel incorporation protein HypB